MSFVHNFIDCPNSSLKLLLYKKLAGFKKWENRIGLDRLCEYLPQVKPADDEIWQSTEEFALEFLQLMAIKTQAFSVLGYHIQTKGLGGAVLEAVTRGNYKNGDHLVYLAKKLEMEAGGESLFLDRVGFKDYTSLLGLLAKKVEIELNFDVEMFAIFEQQMHKLFTALMYSNESEDPEFRDYLFSKPLFEDRLKISYLDFEEEKSELAYMLLCYEAMERVKIDWFKDAHLNVKVIDDELLFDLERDQKKDSATDNGVIFNFDSKTKELLLNRRHRVDFSKSKHQFKLMQIIDDQRKLDEILLFDEVIEIIEMENLKSEVKAKLMKRYLNAANQINVKVASKFLGRKIFKVSTEGVEFNPEFEFLFE